MRLHADMDNESKMITPANALHVVGLGMNGSFSTRIRPRPTVINAQSSQLYNAYL